MPIPQDAAYGLAVRWVGDAYREESGQVTAGDLGTFLHFDGPPGDPEVVVTFPATGTFVTPQANVEPAPA
jgi:hypothetical protein